ncbi:MAG: DUF481 domain-containing protein [Acidobacteriota bacterium]
MMEKKKIFILSLIMVFLFFFRRDVLGNDKVDLKFDNLADLVVNPDTKKSISGNDKLNLNFDFSFLRNTGNVKNISFGTSGGLELEKNKYVIKARLGYNYGESLGKTFLKQWIGYFYSGYRFSERMNMLVLIDYFGNPYTGIRKRLQAGPGIEYVFVKKEEFQFSLAEGVTREIEDSTRNQAEKETLRSAFKTHLKTKLSDKIEFQNMSNFSNFINNFFNDYKIISNSEVSFIFSERIRLVFSHFLSYNNIPPSGFLKADNLYSLALRIKWEKS